MIGTRRIFARVAGLGPNGDKPAAGDLVMIELPANCALFGADAEVLQRIYQIAIAIGEHWRDQQGVNAGLLDQLADATRTMKPPVGDAHDYEGDGPDCLICGEGWMHYVHEEHRKRQEHNEPGQEQNEPEGFRHG